MKFVKLRSTLRSRTTHRQFATAFLSCLGTLCGVTGLFAAIFPDQLKTQGWPYIATVGAISAIYALFVSWPRSTYVHHLLTPHTEIRYTIGDLFAQQDHLVVGFSDTFDTQIPGIISKNSIQGQFLGRLYSDDVVKLDEHLADALSTGQVMAEESVQDKPQGKRLRYTIGTVAVLPDRDRFYFCCAYSRMRNDSVAESSIDELWRALSSLWSTIRDRGQLESVSMAVVGSELARLSSQLSHTDFVRLITLSFLTASRQKAVTQRLTVVIHPKNADSVDLAALAQFVRSQ